MLELVTPEDPWALEMLNKYLPPEDVYWRFSKEEAIQFVKDSWHAAGELWLGDKEKNFLFRLVINNPYVVYPHIMGDGRYIRSCGREAMKFVASLGVRQVVVWTHHANIGRIMLGMGFKEMARLPRTHLVGDELLTLFAFSKEIS